jgi:hypothetical protein
LNPPAHARHKKNSLSRALPSSLDESKRRTTPSSSSSSFEERFGLAFFQRRLGEESGERREREETCVERIRDAERDVRYLFFAAGAKIWRFFFSFFQKCKTLNSVIHKKKGVRCFEREDSPKFYSSFPLSLSFFLYSFVFPIYRPSLSLLCVLLFGILKTERERERERERKKARRRLARCAAKKRRRLRRRRRSSESSSFLCASS